MKKAREMYDLSKAGQSKEAVEFIFNVLEKPMEEAAKKGLMETTFTGPLSKNVIEALEEFGYKVEDLSDLRDKDMFYRISWENAGETKIATYDLNADGVKWQKTVGGGEPTGEIILSVPEDMLKQ